MWVGSLEYIGWSLLLPLSTQSDDSSVIFMWVAYIWLFSSVLKIEPPMSNYTSSSSYISHLGGPVPERPLEVTCRQSYKGMSPRRGYNTYTLWLYWHSRLGEYDHYYILISVSASYPPSLPKLLSRSIGDKRAVKKKGQYALQQLDCHSLSPPVSCTIHLIYSAVNHGTSHTNRGTKPLPEWFIVHPFDLATVTPPFYLSYAISLRRGSLL